MKQTKRILSLVFVLLILVSLCACAKELTPEEILSQRRDIAEAHMRSMATLLWRSDADITYSYSAANKDPNAEGAKSLVHIKAGRVYQGLPYTHAGAGTGAFLEYGGEADENGVYTISGLNWKPLNGDWRTTARIGNDCSSALNQSWAQIGNSLVSNRKTDLLCPDQGYLRVGEYEANPAKNEISIPVCEANGIEVMSEAYSHLQKADGVVKRIEGNGHTMMVVTNHPVRDSSGKIDPEESYVTVIDQTTSYINKDEKYFHEQLGEDVYMFYRVDVKCTYARLFETGYLPITCKEFLDPSPVPEPAVTDTETAQAVNAMLSGNLNATRFIDFVTVTLTDKDGNIVQQITASGNRGNPYTFQMNTFVTDYPEVLNGTFDLNALPSGTYRYRVLCRLVTGDEFTVRDYEVTL